MTEAPTLTDTFMSLFDEAPAPIVITDPITIDETVSAIMDLPVDEWRDFGLDRPTDYSLGSSGQLGLYDLAIGAWDRLGKTVRHDWVMDWGDEAANDGKEFLTDDR